MIQLATVSHAGDYPRSTFAILLGSRRLGDPGFGFPRAIPDWRRDVQDRAMGGGRGRGCGV